MPSGSGLRLSALHAAAFAGIGIYMPFFPLWLEHRGLNASTIGMILALPMIIRIVATAPLMSLADAGLGARRLLILCNLGLVVIHGAMTRMDEVAAILVGVALMAVCQAPIVLTSDLVATDAVRDDPRLNYGRIRSWGSISFLITSIGAGYALDAIDAGLVPWLLAAAALAAIPIALVAAPPLGHRPARQSPGARPTTARVTLKGVPTALWLVFAAAACTQASHAAIYGFGSVHWRELGFTNPTIGYLWAVAVMAEIAVFAGLGRWVGVRSASIAMLALGAGAALVRFGLQALSPDPAVSFGLQALHGLSFGATHLGTMGAITALAPAGVRGRLQGLLGSALALAMAISTAWSGLVYREAGAAVFLAMLPLAGAGLALAVIAACTAPPQPQRAGEGG